MGLDQYAYLNGRKEDGSKDELAYWRKHPNLQGWMENLWIEKGRPVPEDNEHFDGSFNCIAVELTLEDLDRLEADILSGKMAELRTVGFFFGEESDEYYREQDLKFVKEARDAIADGHKVFYDSWW